VTKLQAVHLGNQGSICDRDKSFFSSLWCLNWHWGPQ